MVISLMIAWGDDIFSKRQYLNEKCSQGPDIYDFSYALMMSGTNHKSHKYQGPLSPIVFLILPFGKNTIPPTTEFEDSTWDYPGGGKRTP